MSGARVKTQADFDMDRFIKLMDQALTSKDPRVKDALRSLLMIVALTDPEPESREEELGPLRQMVEDLWNLNRRLNTVEDELRRQKYEQTHPQITPWTAPNTGPYTNPDTGRWFPPPNITCTVPSNQVDLDLINKYTGL
jgi:hypothetical protein